MRFDWWTFALQTINFVVLVWLLHRFLYKPVLRMIDARRAEIEKQYADAAAESTRAKAMLSDLETQRAGIAAERAAALKEAAAQAEEAAARRRNRAERDAAALLAEARNTLAAEREEAREEVRRTALDLGIEVARRLMAEIPAEQRAETWLARVEQHLSGMTSQERDELCKGLRNGGALHVVTAVPLPEPVATLWRARLDRALGDRSMIEFDVDASLVAGVELQFPHAILRFSWRSALSALRAEMISATVTPLASGQTTPQDIFSKKIGYREDAR